MFWRSGGVKHHIFQGQNCRAMIQNLRNHRISHDGDFQHINSWGVNDFVPWTSLWSWSFCHVCDKTWPLSKYTTKYHTIQMCKILRWKKKPSSSLNRASWLGSDSSLRISWDASHPSNNGHQEAEPPFCHWNPGRSIPPFKFWLGETLIGTL